MASALSALLQRSEIIDHEEVLEACNQTLANTPPTAKDATLTTSHVKVVALLKLDRFDDALRVLEAGGEPLKRVAAFEWAYALYKTGKLEEAVDIARSLSNSGDATGGGRRAMHLEAQASYRAEKFARAAKIYEGLLRVADGEGAAPSEDSDLRVNAGAVDAQLQLAAPGESTAVKTPTRGDLESFERSYNFACYAIGMGDLRRAEVLLRRAEELCKASDELTDDDKEAELLPIHVQQLYVALKQVKSDEAAKLVEQINVEEISEPSTRKISINNILLAPSSSPYKTSPYIFHRRFHEEPTPSDSDKLFSYQDRAITANARTIDLLVRKFDGVARSTGKILNKNNSAPTTSAAVNIHAPFNVAAQVERAKAAAATATAAAGESTLASARKHAQGLLKQRPHDVGVLLTVIQLIILEGETRPNKTEEKQTNPLSTAQNVMQNFLARLDDSIAESDQDVRYSPGLISIYVALCKATGKHLLAHTELVKAAKHWQSSSSPSSGEESKGLPSSLLRAAGAALATNPHSEDDLPMAGQLFAHLRELDPTDYFAQAGYVAATATSTTPQAATTLPTPTTDLITGIDASALEDAGVAAPPKPADEQGGRVSVITTYALKRKADEEAAANKKRRLRKSRLPKEFDPSKTPDPERWLPMRERSSYRPPKGKKAKQRAADRTQGGVVVEESNVAAATPAAPVVQQKAGGGGQSSKKKKGKGKR